MTNHPNRGRDTADLAIDFATPCAPDIHAMPKPVRAAGAKIRREIQRRYGKWAALDRNAGAYSRSSSAAFRGVGDRKSVQAEKAHDDWNRLQSAYHAWSQTASGEFRPDPDLLRAVALDDVERYQLGPCVEDD